MARRQLADLVGEELARPAPVSTLAPAVTAPVAPPVLIEPPGPAAPPAEPTPGSQRPEPPRRSRASSAGGPAKPRATEKPKTVSESDRATRSAQDERAEELAALPKHLQLVRKESRLREDQVLELDRLVLKLNRRRRRGEGERITLNTLLRLGADLVLERADDLSGDTEEELSQSLRRR